MGTAWHVWNSWQSKMIAQKSNTYFIDVVFQIAGVRSIVEMQKIYGEAKI